MINQVIRTRRKTLALIVKTDGSVVVRAPLRTSQRVIQEFVEKNRLWIERKRAEVLAVPPPMLRQYVNGEMFLYLGVSYPLEIVNGRSKGLQLAEGTFKLAASQQDATSAFEHWYRRQAGLILKERVDLFASQHGFQYQKISITSARTRWGSCSATGSLSFSWRLVQAPLSVVDYVVIHELAHTVVHNHSREFWQKVEAVLPDYKVQRAWLRDHGRDLLR